MNELPSSAEAERSVLTCVLHDSSLLHKIIQEVPAFHGNDFYHSNNQQIWQAIGALIDRNEGVDVILVRDEMKRRGVLESVGADYLASLIDGVPSMGNVVDYARLVKKLSAERQAVRVLNDGLAAIQQNGLEASMPLLQSSLTTAFLQLPNAKHEVPVTYAPELIGDVMGQVVWQMDNGVHFTGIETGFGILDLILGGWQRGVLTVIGGYTSHSKSASLLEFSISTAEANPNAYVLYFALEMTELMLGKRIMSANSSTALQFVKSGNLSDGQFAALNRAANRLIKLEKRWGITDAMVGLDQIEDTIRAAKATTGLDVVFVDYLQLVEDENEHNREREVNKIGKRFLSIAKELGISVVASAQLNEGVVHRKGHRPLLTDMRESRAINQHARTGILVSRPWLFERTEGGEPEHKPCELWFFVDKNSEGEVGEFMLHYNPATQSLREEACGEGCGYYRRSYEGVMNAAKEEKQKLFA